MNWCEVRAEALNLTTTFSENPGITHLLNKLFINIAYLSEPESAAHAKQLREAFARTIADIEKRLMENARKPSRKANK